MSNLKRLGPSVTLICLLSLTTLAGDTNSPPCAPGDTMTPPCASAPVTADDSVVPGATNSPPASNPTAEYSITELVVDLVDTLMLF